LNRDFVTEKYASKRLRQGESIQEKKYFPQTIIYEIIITKE
jgi:hypothetical protein